MELLRYTSQTQPQVGANLAEAIKAAQVTIIGSPTEVDQTLERQVCALGINVKRV